ncbi:MAG: hypothetical protein IPP65_07090 [Chlorobi bacterium]|nr:hypothetical protein [Chlorobiota bacterium]
MIVLPELASTGYFYINKEELYTISENPENSDYCLMIRSLSEKKGNVIITGFSEKTNFGLLYNSALIAMPDGSYKVYRKSHLFYKEKIIFTQGDTGFFVIEWDSVKIGTMICYDWRFPEAARTLALKGAGIIAHPSNLVASKALWSPVMQSRSIENKLFTITSNRSGIETNLNESLEFSGESQITNQFGEIIESCSNTFEGVIETNIEPKLSQDKSINFYNNLLSDRRNDLYEI